MERVKNIQTKVFRPDPIQLAAEELWESLGPINTKKDAIRKITEWIKVRKFLCEKEEQA